MLPFVVVITAWRLFDTQFGDAAMEYPISWSKIPHVGLPKRPGADKLDEHRWIAKMAAFYRWYAGSWKHRLRSRLLTSSVNTTGFTKLTYGMIILER